MRITIEVPLLFFFCLFFTNLFFSFLFHAYYFFIHLLLLYFTFCRKKEKKHLLSIHSATGISQFIMYLIYKFNFLECIFIVFKQPLMIIVVYMQFVISNDQKFTDGKPLKRRLGWFRGHYVNQTNGKYFYSIIYFFSNYSQEKEKLLSEYFLNWFINHLNKSINKPIVIFNIFIKFR